MQAHSLKHDAIQTLQQLPDDAGVDEIMYRIYVIDQIRKGKEAIKEGKVSDIGTLKQEMEQW